MQLLVVAVLATVLVAGVSAQPAWKIVASALMTESVGPSFQRVRGQEW